MFAGFETCEVLQSIAPKALDNGWDGATGQCIFLTWAKSGFDAENECKVPFLSL